MRNAILLVLRLVGLVVVQEVAIGTLLGTGLTKATLKSAGMASKADLAIMGEPNSTMQ